MARLRVVVRVGVLACVVALLSACSAVTPGANAIPTGTPEPLPSPSTAQQTLIVTLLEGDASAPVMSDQQKVLLHAALRAGELNYEQYAESVQRTLDCASDAGLLIDGPRQAEVGGQQVLVWGWRDPTQPDGDPRVGEACRQVHSAAVEAAYANSDFAKLDEARQLEQYRPQILVCLGSGGAPPDDPDMPILELIGYADQLEGPGATEVHDCINSIEMHIE